PIVSSAMPTVTNSIASSIVDWKRPGTSFMRLAHTARTTTTATVAIRRMSITRFISNGVPSKRNGAGKNSDIEGAWKPPSAAVINVFAALRVPTLLFLSHGQGPCWPGLGRAVGARREVQERQRPYNRPSTVPTLPIVESHRQIHQASLCNFCQRFYPTRHRRCEPGRRHRFHRMLCRIRVSFGFGVHIGHADGDSEEGQGAVRPGRVRAPPDHDHEDEGLEQESDAEQSGDGCQAQVPTEVHDHERDDDEDRRQSPADGAADETGRAGDQP